MLQVTAMTKDQADNCPVRQVLSKVTGKWQLLILFALEDGQLRFGALRRVIGDITQRVLTENLRSLERDGYLTRHVDPGPPVAVSYELTATGQDLVPLLKRLAEWAAQNHGTVRAARLSFDG